MKKGLFFVSLLFLVLFLSSNLLAHTLRIQQDENITVARIKFVYNLEKIKKYGSVDYQVDGLKETLKDVRIWANTAGRKLAINEFFEIYYDAKDLKHRIKRPSLLGSMRGEPDDFDYYIDEAYKIVKKVSEIEKTIIAPEEIAQIERDFYEKLYEDLDRENDRTMFCGLIGSPFAAFYPWGGFVYFAIALGCDKIYKK